MRKVSELYKMYRELPLFQVYIFLLSFYFSLSRESPILVQTLFEALEELCDEDGGENLTLPPHLAPAVVHTFDRVGEQCGKFGPLFCDNQDLEDTTYPKELA